MSSLFTTTKITRHIYIHRAMYNTGQITNLFFFSGSFYDLPEQIKRVSENITRKLSLSLKDCSQLYPPCLCGDRNQSGLTIIHPTSLRKMTGSYLGHDTGYITRCLPWLSSAPPRQGRDIIGTTPH
jgi:hypothetical protein